MKRIALLAALALPALATPAAAQTLWNDLAIGMSRQEVLRLHPDALPGSPDVLWGKPTAELIEADAYAYRGRSFEAHYSFIGDRLTRIILTTPATGPVEKESGLYASIAAELTGLYGQPRGTTRMDNAFSMDQTQWGASGHDVTLIYSDMIDILNISYLVPAGS